MGPSSASIRSAQVSQHLTASKMTTRQFNPDDEKFPTRKELPAIEGAPEGAAWFWGKDDGVGQLLQL